ncbi:phosphoribosylaminoimidazolesuccinocarboxamide synthase [Membranihabitans marinus]|uniref:phosphoribosylaminoimidazolesuccinocarboxamide synthase n=1 Tax=Membranihabitans marinus TaxID=1227546 RepID=UPI001F030566|nr:phosphoribosylaminoimidazolesuccinocarboxamide synthase [Membranihabitans marinus]
MSAIASTDFNFPGQQGVYHGKVRDVYDLGNQLVIVSTDRISAFDHILSQPIPYKGQVLNQTAAYFLNATQDIVPNWLQKSPDPNVSIGLKCEPIKLEMVVRGYLAGHAWREYKAGKRVLCGVTMPEGMKENDAFPSPIITPATKADEGHDEDISKEDILAKKIVSPELWQQLADYSLALFARGTELAKKQDLILVDTKYEFGIHEGKLYLIDEVHTPDSSRYFYADGYSERQAAGEKQRQLSKEFVREWLMDNGFQGLEGQTLPTMPTSFVQTVSERYIELYEKVTGQKFQKSEAIDLHARIETNILAAIS